MKKLLALLPLVFVLAACGSDSCNSPEPTSWLQFWNDNLLLILIVLGLFVLPACGGLVRRCHCRKDGD